MKNAAATARTLLLGGGGSFSLPAKPRAVAMTMAATEVAIKVTRALTGEEGAEGQVSMMNHARGELCCTHPCLGRLLARAGEGVNNAAGFCWTRVRCFESVSWALRTAVMAASVMLEQHEWDQCISQSHNPGRART